MRPIISILFNKFTIIFRLLTAINLISNINIPIFVPVIADLAARARYSYRVSRYE